MSNSNDINIQSHKILFKIVNIRYDQNNGDRII